MDFVDTNNILINYKLNAFKAIFELMHLQRIEHYSDARAVSYANAQGIRTLVGNRFTLNSWKTLKKQLTNLFQYKETPFIKLCLYLLSTKEISIEQVLDVQDRKYRKNNNKEGATSND